eukprot:PhM_4_TR15023/c0_g1_i1/m.6935
MNYDKVISILHSNLLQGNTHAVKSLLGVYELHSDPDFWKAVHHTPTVAPHLAMHVCCMCLDQPEPSLSAFHATFSYLVDVLPSSMPLPLRERMRIVYNNLPAHPTRGSIDRLAVLALLGDVNSWLTDVYGSAFFLLPTSCTTAAPREVQMYDDFDSIPMGELPGGERPYALPKQTRARYKFLPEEDEALIAGVRRSGHSFKEIFLSNAHAWVPGRTVEHLKERWKTLQKRL